MIFWDMTSDMNTEEIRRGFLPDWDGRRGRALLCWGMIPSSDARRRWLGAICLLAAGVMLILGQTVLREQLQDRLHLKVFVCYWATCTALTGLTLIIALLDMRAVRLRLQEEQRKLVKDTLRDIGLEDEFRREKSGGGE